MKPACLRRRGVLALLLLLALAPAVPVAAAPTGKAPASAPPLPRTARATFAGGSFWAVEQAFDRVAGVLATTPGYTGGTQPNPGYEQVAAQRTDHVEAVEVL